MDPDKQKLDEIYRLERDNNRMLRSMRRNAFWGGLFKIILYLFVLGVPIWLYFTYLAPVVEQLNNTMSSISGTRVQIQDQFSGWGEAYQHFKDYFKTASSSSSQ